MSVYSSVLSGVVSALAAEAIDNTSKQAWQKLYSPHEEEQRDLSSLFRSSVGGAIDRTQADCWLAARLHHGLEKRYMSALIAKFSTHKARKVQAITELRSAVIWTKGVSSYTPDYYVELLPTSPWIHQPFEEYDQLRPDGLARKFVI